MVRYLPAFDFGDRLDVVGCIDDHQPFAVGVPSPTGPNDSRY